jgi:hypothetical protein
MIVAHTELTGDIKGNDCNSVVYMESICTTGTPCTVLKYVFNSFWGVLVVLFRPASDDAADKQ